jgi:signal transduction histidine kinase
MTFLALTGLLNFCGNAFLGTLVLMKNPRNQNNRGFFYISASIGLYSTGYFFWQMSATPDSALIWFMILFTGIVMINLFFLFYIFTLLGTLEKRRKELVVHSVISAAFIACNFASLLYDGLEPRHGLGFWPRPLPLFSVYLAFWMFQLVYGFIHMLRSLGRASGRLREQIKYLIASGIIGFIGGASNWPMWYGIDLPPYANILILVYPAVMAYAIIRYRMMEIRLALTRTGIFLVIYAMVLGIPFIIGFKTRFSFLSFLTLFILATLGPLVYRFLNRKAESMLLHRQREYQRMLHESALTLLREHTLDRLLKLVIYGMKNIIKVEYAGIFLEDRESRTFRLKIATSYDVFPEGTSFNREDPAIAAIAAYRRPMPHEKITELRTGGPLRTMQLLVPSYIDDSLIGFLALGEKRNRFIYTDDDIRTFDILSHQTALAIENCMFSEERKQTQERLFHTEKLAFIGGMAEGLAHQMRNRLNHFSIATRQMQLELDEFASENSEFIDDNPALKELFDSLGEIGESMIDNVKRTNSVIQGVLNFTLSKDKNSYFSELAFREILDGAIDLVKIKQGIEDFPVMLETDPTATVYGIMTQIMESLYNIIDNCYEAIEEKSNTLKTAEERRAYTPRITVRLKQFPDASLIEIADNGIGISEEDRKKIFAPYFTTKSSYKSQPGSGIGLYVVHRMIDENHGGKIWFNSEFGKGTSFYIRLPRKNSAAAHPEPAASDAPAPSIISS